MPSAPEDELEANPLVANPLMEGSPVVALVAIVRIKDQAVLAQKADRRATPAKELRGFQAALGGLAQQARELPAPPGWQERRRVDGGDGEASESDIEALGSSGCVFALADPKGLCMACVGLRVRRCPERVVQEILDGLVKQVCAIEAEERLLKAKPGRLSAKTKKLMKEVIESYRDPEQVKRVMHVHQKFDQFKSLMHDNVKRIVENHVVLETLQAQRQSIGASADLFLSQSICKRRQGQHEQKSSLKTKVLMGGSICTVLVLLTGRLAMQS